MEFNPTHKGLMFGIVPVYLDMTDRECPSVQGRNYFCEIFMDMCEPIFMICVFVRSCFDHEYEPCYPIKLTEELRAPV